MLMQIEEIEEMREHGYTVEQISKIIGIGETEVRNILGVRANDIRVC